MTTLGVAPTQTSLQLRSWTKKQGPWTVESQDLVCPRALSINPKLAHNIYKRWRKATHHWRWIEVLIPAWSLSARAIKVQAFHNCNPNEHNWEGGGYNFHSSHLPQVPFSLLFYRSVYSSIWLSNWVVNCERDSWLCRWFSVAFRELVFLCQCDGSISCCTHFEWALCFSFMASLPR